MKAISFKDGTNVQVIKNCQISESFAEEGNRINITLQEEKDSLVDLSAIYKILSEMSPGDMVLQDDNGEEISRTINPENIRISRRYIDLNSRTIQIGFILG